MKDWERTSKLVAEATWQLMPREMAIAAFPREAGPRVLAALVAGRAGGPLWWGDDGFEVTVVAPRETLEAFGLGSLRGTCGEAGEPGSLRGTCGEVGEAGSLRGTCGEAGEPGSLRGTCGEAGEPGSRPGGDAGREGRVTEAARVEAGWALLTCLTPLPWDVVGFLAEVTMRLARAGITCGALSAYSRDHLLVPWPRREEALRLLMRPEG